MKELRSQIVTKTQIRESILTGVILTLTGIFSAFLPFWASLILTVIAVVLFAILRIRTFRLVEGVIFWYDRLLDAIPFPLSITDKDMNWSYINKPVEDMLGIKRKDVVGKHCSNWGAGICNTKECGIACLKRGETQTTFQQMGRDFKVDVAYIMNKRGQIRGHIEVVQDITELVAMRSSEYQAAEEMSGLVEKINDACSIFINNIDSIVGEISALSDGSQTQAQSVEELSSSIGVISGKIDANSRQAAEAASLVQNIEAETKDTSLRMSDMLRAVQDISEAAKSIEKIINVINDIAYQTNILALNAAVEAARAGQYGKGFAVVAEAVRNLASRSAEAAKNTSSLISNSIEKSALGERISAEAAASLDKIIEKIQLSSQNIAQIAEASDMQRNTVMEIQGHVEQVAQIANQNHAAAQQSVAESQALNSHTDELKGLLSDFNRRRGTGKTALHRAE